MGIPINYLAVIAAAVASMIIGFLWYGPVFGKLWMKLSGINPGSMAPEQKKSANKGYILMTIGCLVMAFVLAHALVFASTYTNTYGVMAGISAGFWNWLGFIAPVTMGSVLWEGKSWKLWTLNNGYNLLSLIVMGIILAVWI